MYSLPEQIEFAFERRNIPLKEMVAPFKRHYFDESQTNRFFQVEDILGNHYVVRINGELWPPFTRENEDHNLKCLSNHSLSTHVLENDVQNGFQICHLKDKNHRFTERKHHIANAQQLLQPIALAIKKYHQIGDFKNQYSVGTALLNAFNRVTHHQKNKLMAYCNLSLQIFLTLNNDRANFVSSHNDLLPSSVYIEDQQASIVDWEYSGENHRSYDLALFSLKSALTRQEEIDLISYYDPTDQWGMVHSIVLMKPVVSFLLLLWDLTSPPLHHLTADFLWRAVHTHSQNAWVAQSAKQLTKEQSLGFFYNKPQAQCKKRNSPSTSSVQNTHLSIN